MKFFENKIDLAIVIINFIFLFIFFALLIFMSCFYHSNISVFIILLSIPIFISYLGISVFNLFKLKNLKDTKDSLQDATIYNKTLQILYDNIRTFKHDFFNIIQSIDGYIKAGDLPALKKYYSEIKLECDNLNSLSTLDPTLIDDSGIYNLITSKYYKAEKLGISIDMRFLVKFSSLNISSYTVSRILRNTFR